ncbi:DNA-protecting protein DprA [Pseudoluteimonas lycopersici]|uniref:DNA-protecting protein DprA n=1 Tax=Pseudoluteimonas lycopersici TaxID=1324796 RepID=A0A516V6V7_9GAMM|nr:DNA-processing protein DprA [Lysobacter lycopersici]QDQ74250.1 DNA-protecting protein DprA [Lysobacter lycopersici]
MDSEHAALLALVRAGGAIGPRKRLLERCGSAEAALSAPSATWRECGFETRLPAPARAADAGDAAWLECEGNHLVGWLHPDYPPLLREIPSPPLALFVSGEPARLWHPAIAIVGSRGPSAGGLRHARDFASTLASAGVSVASGLATGIDTAAHEAALTAGGLTLAVLGAGHGQPYPPSQAPLQARIAGTGVVVSEYPPDTPPRRSQFPARNRILAGLALGTLVVEAGLKSGALITAKQAAASGREVFALPGSIDNPLSRGCHQLIRDGAQLVESPDEILIALPPLATGLGMALERRLAHSEGLERTVKPLVPEPDSPDGDPHGLWQALGHDPTDMDELVSRTGLTAASLSSMLLVMELQGRVSVEHGRYSRKR